MKKFVLIFLIFFGGGLAMAYGFSAGWYPAAVINFSGGNSQVIWAKEINQISRAALAYYRRLGAPITPFNEKEARLAALDKIIEKVLISKELETRQGPELNASLQETLSRHQNNPELGPAAAELYGLALTDFYELVLFPQAQRELLDKELADSGQKLDDWLAREKEKVKVKRFIK